ncbi:hypothetical protein I4U23_005583 [Adineta vaga]|nr:hypothetical protein I4U23_005583 [Adineta vaga]
MSLLYISQQILVYNGIAFLLFEGLAFSYGYDFANISSQWWKLRQILLTIAGTMPVTFTCLSTIDQYLITSSNASLRQMSQMKIAYQIIIPVII